MLECVLQGDKDLTPSDLALELSSSEWRDRAASGCKRDAAGLYRELCWGW